MAGRPDPLTMTFPRRKGGRPGRGKRTWISRNTPIAPAVSFSLRKRLALREGHQQFSPEHLLKVLLDDPEGLAAGLIDRSGGNSREALQAVEAALAKRPKVSGGGAGQVYLDPALARVFDSAAEDRREGRRQLRHRRAAAAGARARQGQRGRQDPGARRRHAAEPQRRHRGAAQGPHRRLRRRPRTPMTRSRNTPAT